MLLLNINNNASEPIFRQIVIQIRNMIDADVVKSGSKLPSTRRLAQKLGVNRSTIYKAYEELWALGYLESRPGSYSTVRKRQKLVPIENKDSTSIIPWDKKSSPGAKSIYEIFKRINSVSPGNTISKDIINLSPLMMDNRLFPAEDFRRSMNKVLKEKGGEVLDYGNTQGYQPLREFISNRLRMHSIRVSPENILITGGSQQGIDLIFRLLTIPGSNVIMEEPTYALVIPLLKMYRVNAVGIPMLNTGMDLGYLNKYLKKNKASFVYTITNFQNPTGITTSQLNREKLLNI